MIAARSCIGSRRRKILEHDSQWLDQDSFKVGVEISVLLVPSKISGRTGRIVEVTFPDGHKLLGRESRSRQLSQTSLQTVKSAVASG